jgi:hypothetical protein
MWPSNRVEVSESHTHNTPKVVKGIEWPCLECYYTGGKRYDPTQLNVFYHKKKYLNNNRINIVN